MDGVWDRLTDEVLRTLTDSEIEKRRLYERLRITDGYARAHGEFVADYDVGGARRNIRKTVVEYLHNRGTSDRAK